MADYNLGTAHGQIQVDYNEKATKEAQKDFDDLGKGTKQLIGHFSRLREKLNEVRVGFGQMAARMSRNFAIMSAGSVAILGLRRSVGALLGSLLSLRAGMNVISALGIGLGGLPRRVQGFPNIIKQIILLSSAISLFRGSASLIDALGRKISRLAQSSPAIRQLAARFPFLTTQIQNLARNTPSIGRLGNSINRLARPVHIVARLALVFGTLKQSIRVARGLAVAVGALAGAITVLQAGIFVIGGLTNAVLELGKAGLLLPGIFFAAAASIATLFTGLSGLGEAFKQSSKAAGGAGAAAADTAKAQKAAAEQIRNAKESLAEAERNLAQVQRDAARDSVMAARQVADAQKSLAIVRQDAARSAMQALRSIRDAERNLADAQKDAVRAQRALNDARESASRQLEDMRFQLTGGALDERQAILDLAKAQKEYEAVKQNPNASERQREQLLINLEREQLNIERIRLENQRLGKDSQIAAQKGVEGSDAVVSAQDNLQNSLRSVRDAQEGVRDAFQNARIDAVESARQIARAQRDVADAIYDRTETELQSQRAIADATRQVENAQRALADAYENAAEAGQSAGGAAGAAADAMANISPEARKLVKAILAQEPAWKRVKFAVQDALLKGMAPAITDLANIYLPVLEKGMVDIADSINAVAKEIVAFLKQKDVIDDFGHSFELVGDIIDNLKSGVKPLLSAFRHIAVVGLEVLEDLTAGFGDSMNTFEEWAESARENGNLEKWMKQGIQAIKDLFATLKAIGSILSSIFGAFTKEGETFLGTVRRITEGWAEFLKSTEGQGALKEIATVFRAISGAMRMVLKTAIEELGPVVKELTPFIVALAKAFGTTLATAIKILAPILEQIAKVLSFMSPVLAPILGGLLGLAIASRTLRTAFTALKAVGAVLHAGMSALRGVFWLLLHPIKALKFAIAPLKLLFSGMLSGLIDFSKKGASALKSGIAKMSKAFASGVAAAGSFIARMAVVAAQTAVHMAAAAASVAASVAKQIARWIALAAHAVARAAVIAAAWLAANPVALIAAAVAAIVTAIVLNWDHIVAFLTDVWNWIKELAITVFTAIKDFFVTIGTAIKDFFVNIWNAIKEFFVGLWNGIKTNAITIFTAIKNFFVNIFNAIKKFFVDVWNSIKNFFVRIWNGLVDTVSRAGGRIWRSITSVFNDVVGWISGIPGRIIGALGDFGNLLWNMGSQLIQGLWKGIESALDWLWRNVKNVATDIGDWFARQLDIFSPSRVFAEFGKYTIEGYVVGLDKNKQQAYDMVIDVAKGVAKAGQAINSATNSAIAGTGGRLALSIGARPGAELAGASMAGVSGGKAASQSLPAPIQVDNLELHIAGNLDPTNPTAWRQAIVNIKDGIREVERQYQ